MAFKKGESGNPGGRPKEEREVLDLARQHSPEAIMRLVEWMQSEHPKASPAACIAILDRAYGKPKQAVDLNTPEGISVSVKFVSPEGERK